MDFKFTPVDELNTETTKKGAKLPSGFKFTPVDEEPTLKVGQAPESSALKGMKFTPVDTKSMEADDSDTAGDIASGIGGGLKEQFAGIFLDKEDLTDPGEMSGTELAVNIGTQIVTGIAAGAAIVAAAPTAVVGAIGLGAYAIYSGLNTENVRALHTGQEFSPARAIGHGVLELNPLLKGGGKVIKAARIAGQGSLAFGLEKTYGTGDAGAGIAAALNMVGVAASARGAGKVNPDVPGASKAETKRMVDYLADDSFGMYEKTSKRFDEMADVQLADDVAEAGMDFKRWIVDAPIKMRSKTVDKNYARAMGTMTRERQEEAFNVWKRGQAQAEVTAEIKQKLDSNLLAGEVPVTLLSKVEDPHFVAARVDKVTGIDMVGTLNALSMSKNKLDTAITPLVDKAVKINKSMKKANISGERMGLLKEGKITDATVDELAFLKQWDDLYEEARESINASGYIVKYKENYLNITELDAVGKKTEVRRIIRDAEKAIDLAKGKGEHFNIMDATPEDIMKLGYSEKGAARLVEDITDLTEYYKIKTKDNDVSVFDQLQTFAGNVMKNVDEGDVKASTRMREVGAAFERGENIIPDKFRNMDIGANFLSYVQGNNYSIHMDEVLSTMDQQISALNSLGMKDAAGYFSKLRDFQLGVGGFQAKYNNKMNNYKVFLGETIADDNTKPWMKLGAKALDGALDFSSWASSLVYVNYLGANPKAVMRNLTQTYSLTAPHIGGVHGFKNVTAGVKQLIKTRFTGGGIKQINAELEAAGYAAPVEKVFAGYTELSNVLKGGKLREANEKVSSMLMHFYTQSDSINRYVTLHAARDMAKTVAKEGAKAKGIKNLSTGAKARLKMTELSDTEAVTKIIADDLIASTQFHYGKEQMHEFGRDMGRVFSMFTKWPSFVGSDIVNGLANKEFSRIAWKYGAPLAFWQGANEMYQNVQKSSSKEVRDTMAFAIGKDIGSWAPATSAENIDLFSSPVFRALSSLKSAGGMALEGEGREAFGNILDSVEGFNPIPGSGPAIREINRMSSGPDIYDKLTK